MKFECINYPLGNGEALKPFEQESAQKCVRETSLAIVGGIDYRGGENEGKRLS